MKDKKKSMYKFRQNKIIFITFGLFLLMFPQVSYAYLDPGTGSYIFQIILASLVGVAFTIKIYWTKVKAFLVNLFSKRSQKS